MLSEYYDESSGIVTHLKNNKGYCQITEDIEYLQTDKRLFDTFGKAKAAMKKMNKNLISNRVRDLVYYKRLAQDAIKMAKKINAIKKKKVVTKFSNIY